MGRRAICVTVWARRLLPTSVVFEREVLVVCDLRRQAEGEVLPVGHLVLVHRADRLDDLQGRAGEKCQPGGGKRVWVWVGCGFCGEEMGKKNKKRPLTGHMIISGA